MIPPKVICLTPYQLWAAANEANNRQVWSHRAVALRAEAAKADQLAGFRCGWCAAAEDPS